MILMASRHGLRGGELVTLQWSQLHFESATLHVQQLKQGKAASPPVDRKRAAGTALAQARSASRSRPSGCSASTKLR
jgi:integrase